MRQSQLLLSLVAVVAGLRAADDSDITWQLSYDGKGLRLMSVAQGPDAFYEPYGLHKSTDAAKTWSPITGLDLHLHPRDQPRPPALHP